MERSGGCVWICDGEYSGTGQKPKKPLYGGILRYLPGDPGELLTPWYNRKSIDIIYEDNCEGVFFTPELVQEVVEGFHFLVPYYQYFDALMGDPEPGTP